MIPKTNTPQKTLFKTKYILCTEEQYKTFNELVSFTIHKISN